jgi:succinate-semialdehyde dehydrogenase/glutarate-semialdehyde dehydrogenase
MTQEMGKPLKQSIAEIEKCAQTAEYFADNSPKFLKEEFIQTEYYMSYIRFDPLGLILGIMPWNFPFWQVWRCAIPALCAGNTFILKHSTNVPGCAKEIEKIFNQALPKGVFSSLIIDSSTATQIIEKNLVDAVSLTGSVEAGKQIAQIAGKMLKKTVLELGGSDPFIILEDANLQLACETAVQARTINSGQSCIAAKRFIIVETDFV